jgi:hypothetical protein
MRFNTASTFINSNQPPKATPLVETHILNSQKTNTEIALNIKAFYSHKHNYKHINISHLLSSKSPSLTPGMSQALALLLRESALMCSGASF